MWIAHLKEHVLHVYVYNVYLINYDKITCGVHSSSCWTVCDLKQWYVLNVFLHDVIDYDSFLTFFLQ